MPIRKKYRTKSSYIRKRKPVKTGFLRKSKLSKISSKKGLVKKKFAPSVFNSAIRLFRRKKHRKKQTIFIKRVFKIVFKLAVFFFIVGLVGIVGAFIYFSKDIPNPDKIVNRSVAESTKIYDRTGKHLLYEIHGEEKRTVVNLEDISKHLINATISTEDKSFYTHHGINFKGIARAFWKDISSGLEKVQGGSSITQQLIKNSILGSERTIARKIKEVILAIETEQKFSKDQILEMYLNQIPYGSNAYGIEAASQTFFGKSAKDLNISESALLASLPKAPTYYSPYGAHPDALKNRYKYVIDQMLSEGYITEKEAKQAKEAKILSKVKPFRESIKAPHFVMYIKQQLVDEFGEDKVEKGGLGVYTTLNYEMQLIAEDAIKKRSKENAEKYNAGNAALVAINPKTNQILSMVGSKDYFNIEEDGNVNVAISNRQPGSSFKPFVYATAFQKGYTQNTILFDVYTNFGADGSGKEFRPKNYNLRFSGPVTIKQALARSLNVPAVKMLYLAGIQDSIQTARDMGITTLNDERKYGLSLVLGTGEVKLLEMTSAYGVFANDGIRNQLTSILKIEDAHGNIIKKFDSDPKQVLNTETARNITDILSDKKARILTFGSLGNKFLTLGKRPVAVKTGTTNDYKDGWTIGYTPSLVAGVWAGNNRGEKMLNAGGITVAAPIWNDFMSRVLALDPVEEFNKPETVATKKAILNGKYKNEIIVKIDKACGNKLANELTPESQIERKTYIQVHSILYYVDKDDPQGEYPKNPANDPQFSKWETAVVAWAKKNMGDVNIAPPSEICQMRNEENMPNVKIISPYNDQLIRNGNVVVKAEADAHFGIDQIEFYFDDVLIGASRTSPYEVSYKLPFGTREDSHNITIKVYDKIENLIEKRVSVIVKNNSSIYLKPIIGNDFPFVLSAVVSDSQIKSIHFYYQLDSVYDSDMNLFKKQGADHKIGKADYHVPEEENLYQILWDEDKTYFIPGKYKLFAVLETEDGSLYNSNERYLEIK